MINSLNKSQEFLISLHFSINSIRTLQLYRDFQFSVARLHKILVNSKYAFFSFSCILSFRYVAAILVYALLMFFNALWELQDCSFDVKRSINKIHDC